mmetsp:Transcript_27766/g.89345  ORF Transcript_27766/g.89345 Transcript_27766/m.89345 type:complete len:305 (+) Transcript_27766:45-959(+)
MIHDRAMFLVDNTISSKINLSGKLRSPGASLAVAHRRFLAPACLVAAGSASARPPSSSTSSSSSSSAAAAATADPPLRLRPDKPEVPPAALLLAAPAPPERASSKWCGGCFGRVPPPPEGAETEGRMPAASSALARSASHLARWTSHDERQMRWNAQPADARARPSLIDSDHSASDAAAPPSRQTHSRRSCCSSSTTAAEPATAQSVVKAKPRACSQACSSPSAVPSAVPLPPLPPPPLSADRPSTCDERRSEAAAGWPAAAAANRWIVHCLRSSGLGTSDARSERNSTIRSRARERATLYRCS